MEPFYIIGNIAEPLFKKILITIKEMSLLFWRSTAFGNAILGYIHKIGSYVWNSLGISLECSFTEPLTLLRGTQGLPGTHFENYWPTVTKDS